MRSKIILGIGTNRGDRLGCLRQAIHALGAFPARIKVLKLSPIYESEAMLPEGAPQSWNQPFLNLCLLAESDLHPEPLLAHIKELECRIGRRPSERWAPREIDIDILAMESGAWDTPRLRVPHRDFLNRPFALLPAVDLAPGWKISTDSGDRTLREIAAPWLFGDPELIPFRTRRSALFLQELVGIMNITPDSFSDGGECMDPDNALLKARRLIAEGASVIDIGAESTRPDAIPVTAEEEWRRLEPVLAPLVRLCANSRSMPRVSVDTRHPTTAARAIQAGAHWINDVSGCATPEIKRVLADAEVDVVFMHSLSIPPGRGERLPWGANPTDTILRWGEARVSELEKSGISRARLIFDPGIGFGKTPEQNALILRNAGALKELGVRVLVGHSRKSFFSRIPGGRARSSERDIGTLAVSAVLARSNVDYLRVHNVAMHSDFFRVSSWLDGTISMNPLP